MHPVHGEFSSLYQEVKQLAFLRLARFARLLGLNCRLPGLTRLQMPGHLPLLKLPLAKIADTRRGYLCLCHVEPPLFYELQHPCVDYVNQPDTYVELSVKMYHGEYIMHV